MQHFMRVSPRVHRLGEEHDLRVIGRVLRAMQHTHTNTQPMPYDHRAQERAGRTAITIAPAANHGVSETVTLLALLMMWALASSRVYPFESFTKYRWPDTLVHHPHYQNGEVRVRRECIAVRLGRGGNAIIFGRSSKEGGGKRIYCCVILVL